MTFGDWVSMVDPIYIKMVLYLFTANTYFTVVSFSIWANETLLEINKGFIKSNRFKSVLCINFLGANICLCISGFAYGSGIYTSLYCMFIYTLSVLMLAMVIFIMHIFVVIYHRRKYS